MTGVVNICRHGRRTASCRSLLPHAVRVSGLVERGERVAPTAEPEPNRRPRGTSALYQHSLTQLRIDI